MKQLFLLAIMAFTLSSCSKEDEPEVVIEYAESIIGKWWEYETYYYDDDRTIDLSEDRIHRTFAKEGTYKRHEDGVFKYENKYRVEGSNLIYIDPDGTVSTELKHTIKEITPDYMEIEANRTYIYEGERITTKKLYKYKRLL